MAGIVCRVFFFASGLVVSGLAPPFTASPIGRRGTPVEAPTSGCAAPSVSGLPRLRIGRFGSSSFALGGATTGGFSVGALSLGGCGDVDETAGGAGVVDGAGVFLSPAG